MANEENFCGVSVCIATYNAEGFISKTLDSILAQTYSNFRCIISDDASSDQTAAICQNYARADRRIKLYSHTQRLGWTGNFNRACTYASGSYLMYAPHDDVIAPCYLEMLVTALEKKPDAALAFSDMEIMYPDGKRTIHKYDELANQTSPKTRALKVLQRKGDWWVSQRGVIRSSVFKDVGGLYKIANREFAADWPWTLRLALAGEFIRIPHALYTKHAMPNSTSSNWVYCATNWLPAFCDCLKVVTNSNLSKTQILSVYLGLVPYVTTTIIRLLRRTVAKAFYKDC